MRKLVKLLKIILSKKFEIIDEMISRVSGGKREGTAYSTVLYYITLQL